VVGHLPSGNDRTPPAKAPIAIRHRKRHKNRNFWRVPRCHPKTHLQYGHGGGEKPGVCVCVCGPAKHGHTGSRILPPKLSPRIDHTQNPNIQPTTTWDEPWFTSPAHGPAIIRSGPVQSLGQGFAREAWAKQPTDCDRVWYTTLLSLCPDHSQQTSVTITQSVIYLPSREVYGRDC
jgi:hypothetical protein